MRSSDIDTGSSYFHIITWMDFSQGKNNKIKDNINSTRSIWNNNFNTTLELDIIYVINRW